MPDAIGDAISPYTVSATSLTLIGWMTVVELGQSYTMEWEFLEHFTNISYSIGFYDIVSVCGCLILVDVRWPVH